MPETTTSYEPITFDAIRIGLASPEKILEWSHGEVKKPETAFSGRARTGSATAENIRKFVIRVWFATAAASR